ncbi:MAG: hypothetical protein ACKOC7_02225, partial [Sphingomonadales bacterium]
MTLPFLPLFRNCVGLLIGMGLFVFLGGLAQAQPSYGLSRGGSTYSSFIDYQRSFTRPLEAMTRKVDTLKKQFAAKRLNWPANYIYIRSFKYNSELQVWVKEQETGSYKHFKSYRVCALAGSMGPKRMEGDYQV